MTEPRVKVYGLLRLSRRAYLGCQVAGFLLGVAVLALGLLLPRQKAEKGEPLVAFVSFFNVFLDALPWIAFLVLILMAVETCVVLKKFDRLASGGCQPPGDNRGVDTPRSPSEP